LNIYEEIHHSNWRKPNVAKWTLLNAELNHLDLEEILSHKPYIRECDQQQQALAASNGIKLQQWVSLLVFMIELLEIVFWPAFFVWAGQKRRCQIHATPKNQKAICNVQ
jgi:hypothetical protein